MRLNLTASVNSDLNLAAIALLGKNDVNAIQAWASDDTDDMGNVSLQLQPGSPENVDGYITQLRSQKFPLHAVTSYGHPLNNPKQMCLSLCVTSSAQSAIP